MSAAAAPRPHRAASRRTVTRAGRAAALALLAALAAGCAPQVNVPGAPTVRHTESTVRYGDGARWHLFFFDPTKERSLDDRIALARAATAQDAACRWVGAPRAEIEERTHQQGARYAQTVLAAPLRCR